MLSKVEKQEQLIARLEKIIASLKTQLSDSWFGKSSELKRQISDFEIELCEHRETLSRMKDV